MDFQFSVEALHRSTELTVQLGVEVTHCLGRGRGRGSVGRRRAPGSAAAGGGDALQGRGGSPGPFGPYQGLMETLPESSTLCSTCLPTIP